MSYDVDQYILYLRRCLCPCWGLSLDSSNTSRRLHTCSRENTRRGCTRVPGRTPAETAHVFTGRTNAETAHFAGVLDILLPSGWSKTIRGGCLFPPKEHMLWLTHQFSGGFGGQYGARGATRLRLRPSQSLHSDVRETLTTLFSEALSNNLKQTLK